jgi:hypothetical protein
MQHLDEHTIELYILGSDLVKGRISEIEAHLAECHGCRLLADQMKVFYEKAEKELERTENITSEPGKALVIMEAELDFVDRTFSFPVRPLEKRYLARFLYYIYKHPVKAAFGGATVMALFVAAMFFSVNNPFKDKNPSYPILNPNNGRLEIYNQKHDLLWSIPSKNLNGTKTEQLNELYKYVNIFDINEDGKNEVITALPLGDQILTTDTLRIISADKSNIRKFVFEDNINFNGKIYDTHWSVAEIHCVKYYSGSRPEIFLLADNGRSPTIFFRMDNNGKILGEYVHYGFINKLFFDTSGTEKRIFLCGQNDLGEVDSLSSPVLVALDPSKIFGRTESSCTEVFGLERSNAEIFYIRFPLTDLNYFWKTHGFISRITEVNYENRKRYSAWIVGGYNIYNPIFEYVISDDMRVLEVKYDSQTLQLRQKLLNEKKIKGTFDSRYLQDLKNRVAYWDGLKWRKEITKVKFDILTSDK